MKMRRQLAALLAAGALGFAVFGTVTAHIGASDRGVTPTLGASGNIGFGGGENKDTPNCAEADGITTGDSGGSDTTDNGVTVTWTYDATTKSVGFTATGGLVTYAYIKGGNGYNIYNYTAFVGGGVAWDGHLHAPDTNGDGNVQGLSHAVFCTGPGEEPSEEPSFEQSQEGETDEPSELPSELPSEVPSEAPSEAPSFEQSQEGETDAPSFFQSQEGQTDAPSEPDTSTITTGGPASPADSAWLLVVALGVLLASVVVLTPARAKSRR